MQSLLLDQTVRYVSIDDGSGSMPKPRIVSWSHHAVRDIDDRTAEAAAQEIVV
jgi:hypothetical protein